MQLTSERVLLIDDDVDNAAITAEVLSLYGFVTRVAYDGETGIAQVDQFLPSVVIIDIGMPYMDGYDVAARLRGLRATRNANLIAYTGYSCPSIAPLAIRRGFNCVLQKPATVRQLLTAVSGKKLHVIARPGLPVELFNIASF